MILFYTGLHGLHSPLWLEFKPEAKAILYYTVYCTPKLGEDLRIVNMYLHYVSTYTPLKHNPDVFHNYVPVMALKSGKHSYLRLRFNIKTKH